MPTLFRIKLYILLILIIALFYRGNIFAGSLSFTNIYTVLNKQNIKYDKAELQNAAINGMLGKIDIRARLFTTNELVKIKNMRAKLKFEKLNENIGYLKVSGIYQNTDNDICSFIATNNCFNGNIIDLRGAGGNNLAAIASIMSCFYTNHVFLFSVQNNTGKKIQDYFTDTLSNNQVRIKQPLMVLINNKTSGASLILAALLKGRRNVMLIGESGSHPRGLMDIIALSNGESLYLPVKFVVVPGICYSNGVVPDVVVKQKEISDKKLPVSGKVLIGKNISVKAQNDRILMERIKDDVILQRAVDLLLGIKAVNKDNF